MTYPNAKLSKVKRSEKLQNYLLISKCFEPVVILITTANTQEYHTY